MSSRALQRLPDMERSAAIVCRLQGVVDLCVLDALARLQLVARRRGLRLEVLVCGEDLGDLLALTGLTDVLLQPIGQPEPREERWRVEEVVEVDQPPV